MRPLVECECGEMVRQKPYASGKVGIPILIPFNSDGTLHFCYQPKITVGGIEHEAAAD